MPDIEENNSESHTFNIRDGIVTHEDAREVPLPELFRIIEDTITETHHLELMGIRSDTFRGSLMDQILGETISGPEEPPIRTSRIRPSLEIPAEVRDYVYEFDSFNDVYVSTRGAGSTFYDYNSLLKKKDEVIYEPNDKVILKNGEEALFKDCVKISNNFYLKTDENVVIDHFTKEYCLKSRTTPIYVTFHENGKINYDKQSYFIHSFGSKNNDIVEIYDGQTVITDWRCIPKDFYDECIKTNRFILKGSSRNAVLNKTLKIKARSINNTYKPSFNRSVLKKDYEMGVLSPTFIKTEGKRYSFGLELETISGTLPVRVDNYLNYSSVKDGSLRDSDGEEYGNEYVTGVLTGDTGLLQVKKLCNELTPRCMVNIKCGLHVHLGVIEFNSELIVYLYKLYLMVEQEIFDMMPLSRRNNEYCRQLNYFDFSFSENDFNNVNIYKSKIEKYYLDIYRYVSATSELPSSKANKKTQHPLGPKCGYNHNTARYCWVNLVPTVFDTRENGECTVEIRIHQGSTNFTKIKNWTLINMGLLWFAENHKKIIALSDKISLEEIMTIAYPKTHKELNDYINLRKEKFNMNLIDTATLKENEIKDYNEIIDNHQLTIKSI